MGRHKLIKCDVAGCPTVSTEDEWGDGFPNWGSLQGVALNGVANPTLCPIHLATMANHLDKLIVGDSNGVD